MSDRWIPTGRTVSLRLIIFRAGLIAAVLLLDRTAGPLSLRRPSIACISPN